MKTKKETIVFIQENSNNKKISNILKSIKNEVDFYISSNISKENKLTLKAYSLINNLIELPKCKICNSNKIKFISFQNGFNTCCSKKCDLLNKKEENIIELNELKIIIDKFYLKIKPSEYSKYIEKNNILSSILYYTNFLPNNIKNTQRLYSIMNDLKSIPLCKNCGLETKYINFKIGYRDFCSTKCSSNSIQKINKIKTTNLIKYGKENVSQVESIKDKRKSTNLDLYGKENVFQNEDIKNKIKQTNIQKYGFNVSSKNENIIQKINDTKKNTILNGLNINQISGKMAMETKLKLYNGIYKDRNKVIENNRKIFIINKINIFKELNIIPLFDIKNYNGVGNKYSWKCLKCNTSYHKNIDNGVYPLCPVCNKIYLSSNGEQDLINFVSSLNLTIDIRNRKIINPQEIDIFIPSKNMAIEYNGLYFHSFEKFMEKNMNIKNAVNYHLNKLDSCKKQNINLLHIFEHEWLFKKDIIKSIINNKLSLNKNRINARDCYIKEINSIESNDFLEKNHLQGKDNAKIRIGLFLKKELPNIEINTLISVMTFSKSRFNKSIQYEMKRFCSLLNFNINGGASKILAYFEKTYNPQSLITYADKRFSFNTFYEKIGFEFQYDTKPNYFYFKNYNVYSREYFMKFKIKEYFENQNNSLIKFYSEEMTEYENMLKNNYRKIYDCGNKVYIKKYNI